MGNIVNLLVYLAALSVCPTLLIHYEGVIIVSWKISLHTVSQCHTLDKLEGRAEI